MVRIIINSWDNRKEVDCNACQTAGTDSAAEEAVDDSIEDIGAILYVGTDPAAHQKLSLFVGSPAAEKLIGGQDIRKIIVQLTMMIK